MAGKKFTPPQTIYSEDAMIRGMADSPVCMPLLPGEFLDDLFAPGEKVAVYELTGTVKVKRTSAKVRKAQQEVA